MREKGQKIHLTVVVVSIALMSLGTFNLVNNAFAQPTGVASVKCVDSTGNEILCAKPFDLFIQNIFEQLLSTVGPIVAGAVSMGVSFARKKGLAISADAEEYFVKSARSFVDNQSRYIFKQFMENPGYREQLANGKMPEELGKQVFQNVKGQLLTELKSDEFTKVARNMLVENLDSLIERTLSQSKNDNAEKARKLLKEFVPIAVDSSLLYVKENEITDEQKREIINRTLKIVAKNFDAEYIIMSVDSAKMYIEAELKRRIDDKVS
ncbi:MAG: hypothetical protein KC483_02240 [Nitrosarchaeum sp.]|nr:hypothetical protein [Nitrosarchaeum sp.]MCA9819906.1 hypothetical protein [Nitrosarchaeum sp.]